MAVKPVIKGVHIVPMGFANAFLIEGDDGLMLVDAGFPGKESVVFETIRGLGRSPDQLKHLDFTHAHPDHVGSAAGIVRGTGARTYLHPFDIPIAETGGPFRPMTPAPTASNFSSGSSSRVVSFGSPTFAQHRRFLPARRACCSSSPIVCPAYPPATGMFPRMGNISL
jgi:glyoxylase-like metal-dependent hydrolase (beta-lactamase superfamily II)